MISFYVCVFIHAQTGNNHELLLSTYYGYHGDIVKKHCSFQLRGAVLKNT